MLTIEKWAIYTNAGVFVAISSFYTRLYKLATLLRRFHGT